MDDPVTRYRDSNGDKGDKGDYTTTYDSPKSPSTDIPLDGIDGGFVDPEEESTWKTTRFRWFVIFVLSFSGDGWSYEASVISSVLNMPQFIARRPSVPRLYVSRF